MTHAMPSLQDYIRFLEAKASVATEAGFIVDDADLQTHLLKPHQQVMVKWALRKGRGLIAASFGLGKTRVQCEMLRLMHERTGQKMLVICPLGVRQQFTKMDGPIMGLDFCYVGCDEDVLNADTPYQIADRIALPFTPRATMPDPAPSPAYRQARPDDMKVGVELFNEYGCSVFLKELYDDETFEANIFDGTRFVGGKVVYTAEARFYRIKDTPQ